MNDFTVVIKDNKGDIIFEKSGTTVIAGVATGDNASVAMFPAEETSAISLIGACEELFEKVTGGDEDEMPY